MADVGAIWGALSGKKTANINVNRCLPARIVTKMERVKRFNLSTHSAQPTTIEKQKKSRAETL